MTAPGRRPGPPPRLVGWTALAVVVASHVYLLDRLVADPALPPVAAILTAVAILGLVPTVLLRGRIGRRLSRRGLRAFSFGLALWLGVAWIALAATALVDVALALVPADVLAGAFASGPLGGGANDAARSHALLVLGLTVAGTFAGLTSALRGPSVRRVEVEIEGLAAPFDGFRIVQLSDLHVGAVLGREFATRVTERVNAIAPDAIVVTGDLVDGAVDKIADEVAPLGELRAPHGTFFVTGNHDRYSGDEAWVEYLAGLGWTILRSARVTIELTATEPETPPARLDLAGIDDVNASRYDPGEPDTVDRALEGREADRPVVLLSHNPGTFPHAVRHGVDLQLSGHTHGGQIWPFAGIVRVFHRHVAGLYRAGRSQIYVSRGTGFWGPPMRLFAPAEIAEIVLRSGRPIV